MTPQQWSEIKSVFLAALERPAGERAAFLEEACGGDEALRREVEALLGSHEEVGGFLETPAALLGGKTRPALAAGRRLGHYRIISLLGAGGMGEVYLADDTRLHRKVALKLLPGQFTADRESLLRFEREAHAASALNHPNILTVHDIGESEGTHFIATEYVDGQTLRQFISNGALRLSEALEVAVQVASALSAAHAAGIIHRDIKPDNVMVRADGLVKVLDFGLAKLTATEMIDPHAATTLVVSTVPGMVMGTPMYMSPEQTRGLEVDARTDIWSLGVVLYEMIAGEAPFGGATASDVVAAILKTEPPPIAARALDTPLELQRIVSKTLEKERGDRHQGVNDLLVDLRRLKKRLDFEAEMNRSGPPVTESNSASTAGGHPSEAVGDASPEDTGEFGAARSTTSAEYLVGGLKRHKRGAALALAALVAAAVSITFGPYQFGNQNQSPTISAAPLQLGEPEPLTSTGNAGDAAISPDGKFMAHVSNKAGRQSLVVRDLATLGTKDVAPPAESHRYFAPTFSPDGNYVYYLVSKYGSTTHDLFQVSAFGGPSRKIIEGVDSPVTFSPDGRRFAFVRNDPSQEESALIVVSADGGGEKKLVVRKLPEILSSGLEWSGLAWSPDGKIIAYAAGTLGANNDTGVFTVSIEGGAESPINSPKWWRVNRLAWLGDNSGLLLVATDKRFGAPQIWHLSYPEGSASKLTNDLNGYNGLSVTANSGVLLTTHEEQFSKTWVVPNGDVGHATPVASGQFERLSRLSWTPDDRIVYSSGASGRQQIWIITADGSNQKQLTVSDVAGEAPSVSPDGRYIVYNMGTDDGRVSVWRMNSDGSELKQLTNGGNEYFPQCSPDGQWVIYSEINFDNLSKSTTWKVPIDGGHAVRITDEHSSNPTISPDGKLLAYYDRSQGSTGRVEVVSFGDGKPVKTLNLPPRARLLRWTSDGRALTYVDERDNANVWSQPAAGGPRRRLTNFKSDRTHFFDWSRDGKQLAITRVTFKRDVVLIKGLK